jgi:hypothetical protein
LRLVRGEQHRRAAAAEQPWAGPMRPCY